LKLILTILSITQSLLGYLFPIIGLFFLDHEDHSSRKKKRRKLWQNGFVNTPKKKKCSKHSKVYFIHNKLRDN